MTELRRRMVEDMQLHGFSPGTQQTYLWAIIRLAKHFQRSPDQISEDELRTYLLQLTDRQNLAPSTARVRLYAIKFLFAVTLKREWPVLRLARVKLSKRLPVVLSREEVRDLLRQVQHPVARMCLMLMYACGLRVSEAAHLRPEDIDSKRMVVCVRHGKGDKDRYVPLSGPVLQRLREYWLAQRPDDWLFPCNGQGQGPMDGNALNRCLRAARQDNGTSKHVSCHTLRHSYATHLLENGVDLLTIQRLLGHRSIRSTLIYLHLTRKLLDNVQKTVDQLTADF